jgi:hypothetical protein
MGTQRSASGFPYGLGPIQYSNHRQDADAFGTTDSDLASLTALVEGMDGHLYGTADSVFMVSAVIPGK